jgi:O-antigen/teichoic acid export membrane protein
MKSISKLEYYKKKYRSLIGNSSSLFSIKTIDLVLGFLLIPYLILKVGMHYFGVYAFAMALALFFVNILNYGFNLSAVRDIATSKKDALKVNRIFNEVFWTKLFIFILLFPTYLILVYRVPQFSQYKTLYIYSSLLLFGDLFSLRWLFMGLEKMKFIALIHLVGTSIYVVLVYCYIKHPLDYYKIPMFHGIGMIFTSLSSFVWIVKKHKIKIRRIPFSQVMSYLKINFSSFVNSLLPSTYGSVLVFIVGWVGLPIQVSFIHIGLKFTAAFSTLNNVLTNVFFPIANRKKNSLKSIRKALNSIGLFMSLLMFVSASYLVQYWLHFENTIELENTIDVLQLLSPVPFLMALISSYGVNGLLVIYKDSLYGIITMSSSLIMVVLALVLVPSTLFLGGAIAFLIGRSVYALLSYYFFKKMIQYAK